MVLIVSPLSILSGSNHLVIKAESKQNGGSESHRDYPMFNNHRLFGPIGYVTPAEADYYAARKDLDIVA